MILFATVSACLTFNNIPQIDPHDDMAEIRDRQKYERDQMSEHKSNQHADDDIRERYLGWNPLPMQGATVGAPPSKDKVYGIVAEKFDPNQPLLRPRFCRSVQVLLLLHSAVRQNDPVCRDQPNHCV